MFHFNKYFKLFCMVFILIVGAVYFGYGSYANWIELVDNYTYPFIYIVLLGLVVTAAIYFFASLPISNKLFLIGALVIAFLVRLGWVLYASTDPISDFLLLNNAAVSAANGDFSFSEDTYFTKWVYQIGFVMYQALVITLFGEDIFILQFLNILYSVGLVWLIYLIAKELFNETAGRIAGVIYSLYVPAIIMTSVLTNQILATLLFYAGAYLLVKHFNTHNWAWIFVGVLFALGNIIRPLGSFVLLAAGLFIFVVFILGVKRKTALITSGKLAGTVMVYMLLLTIVNQSLIMAGVTNYPLENRDPHWKFVLGLNHETNGSYSGKDSEALKGLELQTRLEKEEEMIQNRLADKSELLQLFKEKFEDMWGSRDASIFWSYKIENENSKENVSELLYRLDKLIYVPLFLFGLLSVVILARNMLKDNDHHSAKALYFVLFIIGYAMIHLLIEIQTRYRLVMIPGLVIIQSLGVYTCCHLITSSFKKEKFEKILEKSS